MPEPASAPGTHLSRPHDTGPQQTTGIPVPAWCKDAVAAFVLFAATAAVVIWQNSRLGVLWDLSFVLEQAYRISLGQVPYRDFPLAYPPLTFLTQATLIKITGTVVWHHVAYAAVVGGLATVLTWRIALTLLRRSVVRPRVAAFCLSLPLTVLGIYCIYPHPGYDGDCTFTILAAILLLLYAEEKDFPRTLSFMAGMAMVVPAFVKQNTGLAFLGGATVAILALLLIERSRGGNARGYAVILCGVAVGSVLAAVLIDAFAGLSNYLHWTITVAAERQKGTMWAPWAFELLPWWFVALVAGALLLWRRPGRPGQTVAALMVSVPFAWTSACVLTGADATNAAECLLSLWPFIVMVSLAISILSARRRTGMALTLPFVIIVTTQGAFLSQGVWGSTYALWPLAVVLIASTLAALAHWTGDGSLTTSMISVVIGLSLTLSGSHYAWSGVRLDYADVWQGQPQTSAMPALQGLTVGGDWLRQFDQLADYVKAEIPPQDGVLVVPGEDLFHYATGRTPHFPVLMFDQTGNPYTPEELVRIARTQDIRWLVVKRKLQLKFDPTNDGRHLLDVLLRECTKAWELENYDVYRCRFDSE